MKIEILYDGSNAKTLINGKHVNICSDIEHNFMFKAFDCIKKHIEREKKYLTKKQTYEILDSKKSNWYFAALV